MACNFISLVVIWELVLPPLLGCKGIRVRDLDLLIILQVQEQYLKLGIAAIFNDLNENKLDTCSFGEVEFSQPIS